MSNQKHPWQVDVLERLPVGMSVDALPWPTNLTIVLIDPQGNRHDGEKVSIADLPGGTMELVRTLAADGKHVWKKTQVSPAQAVKERVALLEIVKRVAQEGIDDEFKPITDEQAEAFVRAIHRKTERDQEPKTISIKANERGFLSGDFQDLNGIRCSIQKSSLATDSAIWLGVHPAPDEHERRGYGPTRMHLNRQHVAALLPLLKHFAETGELPRAERDNDE